MTFDQWKYTYDLCFKPNYSEQSEKDCWSAFEAGAASRDAEIKSLRQQLAATEPKEEGK